MIPVLRGSVKKSQFKLLLVVCLVLLLSAHASSSSSSRVNLAILQRMTDARVALQECNTIYVDESKSCARADRFKGTVAAALLAVKDFNDRNPRFVRQFDKDSELLGGCNKVLVPDIMDSGSTGTVSVRNIIGAIASKEIPDAVIGPSRSDASQPVNVVVGGAYGIPQISYGSTSIALDNTLIYPSFMRTIPADSETAWIICEYLREIGYKYSSILYVIDSYGESFRTALLSQCKSTTFQVFSYIDNDMKTVEESLTAISQTGVNSLILISTSETGFVQEMLRKAYAYGVVGKGRLLITTDGVSPAHFPVDDTELQAAMNGSLLMVPTGGVDGTDSWETFRRNWSNFDVNDVNPELPEYWQLAHDFYEKTIYGPDTSMVKIFGAYEYDAIAAIGLFACMYDKTQEIPVEWWNKWFTKVSDDGVMKNVEKLKFDGLTGEVRLDSKGNRLASTATYEAQTLEIINGIAGFRRRQIFNRAASLWTTVAGADIFYNGNSYSLPPDVIPRDEDKQFLGSAAITSYIVYVLLGGVTIFCFIWTILNRNYKVVVASQFEFLVLITFGVFISVTTLVPLAVDDENDQDGLAYYGEYEPANTACMASVWLYNLGFVITFVPLFVKMWRVNKLFNNPKLKRIVISNKLLFKIILVFLVVEFAILIPWQVVYPVRFIRKVTQRDLFGFPIASVGYCRYDMGSPSVIFLSVLLTLHLVYLIVGCFLCYFGRHIETKYQEGKYVTIAIITYIQVLAVSIPVVVLSYGEPVTSLIIRIIVIFLNNMTVLCCLFWPKMYMLNFLQRTHSSNLESIRHGKSSTKNISKSKRESHHNDSNNKNEVIRPDHDTVTNGNKNPNTILPQKSDSGLNREEYQIHLS